MHTTSLALLLTLAAAAPGADAASQTPQPGAERERPVAQDTRAASAVRYLRASQLEGADVRTERAADAGSDSSLGEVAAFHVALDTGRLTHALVSSGGLAGIGAERRAVPIDRLRWTAEEGEDGHYVATLTRSEFERLPVLDEDAAREGGERAVREGSGQRDAGAAPASARRPARVLSTDRIRGTELRLGDASEEDAAWGEVAGFAVAMDGRELAYAIVERGGVAGVGAAEHPVPWRALRLELEHEGGGAKPEDESGGVAMPDLGDPEEPVLRISLPMTQAELETAPKLDADAGRTLEAADFRREVDVFYGVEPTDDARVGDARPERPESGEREQSAPSHRG